MKRILIASIAAIVLASAVSAQTAEEIVQKSKERIKVDTVSTRGQMNITAKDGSVSERVVDQYGSKKDGLERAVIVFQKPANVANIRFLVLENKDRDSDRWIFLPSLGKIRRIASGEGSGSFVGSDFSYDDIDSAGRDVAKDNHSLLREEDLGGDVCWVIESKSKDPDYQYSKTVRWISKASLVARKAEMYDKKGALLKLLEIQKVEKVQGLDTPMLTKMSNVQEKTSTTLVVQIIKYNDKIPDSVFTTRYLETGRP